MDPILLPILLLIVGLALFVLDFFLPSGGVLSAAGAIALIAALVMGFSHGFQLGAILFVTTAILIPVVFVLAIKLWPHTPLGRLILISKAERQADTGEPSRLDQLRAMIGQHGTAQCDMLPGGAVKVDYETYDAVSEGAAIERGDVVEIVAVRNSRLVVRAIPQPQLGDDDPTGESLLERPIDSVGIESLDDPLA